MRAKSPAHSSRLLNGDKILIESALGNCVAQN